MIRCVLLKTFSMMMGEIEDLDVDTYQIKNPMVLVPQPNGSVGALGILAPVQEKTLRFKKSELFSTELFNPIQDLLNQYNHLHGSGLVVPFTPIQTR